MKRRQFLEAAAALPMCAVAPQLLAKNFPSDVNTKWTISMKEGANGTEAKLFNSINGGTPTEFTIRGVCYSPCPINGSNADAPNIGDWFWDTFSGTGYKITGWNILWDRDFPELRKLGVNTIRVYGMMSRQLNDDGSYPQLNPDGSFPKDLHLFTHKNFLDKCWNNGVDPIYVLVGIPLPDKMLWKNKYDKTNANEKAFWVGVLSETVAQVSAHPAVLGFTIQNELDGAEVCYGRPGHPEDITMVKFWWSQVEKMAGLAKKAMGSNVKIVGMACHDDPLIPGKAATYMAECPSIDYWGVNSYNYETLKYVFDEIPKVGPGYAGLPSNAKKPVILTEWGIPATGHRLPNDPSSIYYDEKTVENTAKSIRKVVPQAYNGDYPLCLGLYYFEYSDEWWNQPGSPNIYTWWGGKPNIGGFPNDYWDQDGFGLYSIKRGGRQPNNANIWFKLPTPSYGHPNPDIDVLTQRQGTFNALKETLQTKMKVK